MVIEAGIFEKRSTTTHARSLTVSLTGPDLTNNLVGVLMRFREEKVAVTGDIKQMFFNFEVNEKQRNFLRFLWFQDSNIEKPIIEYRMRVHVFGNAPSPAVATLGLRMSVCDHDSDSTQCDKICEEQFLCG